METKRWIIWTCDTILHPFSEVHCLNIEFYPYLVLQIKKYLWVVVPTREGNVFIPLFYIKNWEKLYEYFSKYVIQQFIKNIKNFLYSVLLFYL